MGSLCYYDVFDDGELILENVTRKDIESHFNAVIPNLTIYDADGIKYRGIYTIIKKNEGVKKVDTFEAFFSEEWTNAVKPFKKVKWSKTRGRKLILGGQ